MREGDRVQGERGRPGPGGDRETGFRVREGDRVQGSGGDSVQGEGDPNEGGSMDSVCSSSRRCTTGWSDAQQRGGAERRSREEEQRGEDRKAGGKETANKEREWEASQAGEGED